MIVVRKDIIVLTQLLSRLQVCTREREVMKREAVRRHIIGFLLFSEEINKFGFGTKKDIFDNLPTQRKSLLLKIKHYHGLDCTMS